MELGIERASVIGLGKLGAPLAACLAAKGLTVVGVDTDRAKVDAVNRRRAPVFEPQLEEMIQAAAGRLSASTRIADGVAASDVTFVVVATPSEPNGEFSLRFLLPVCEEIGRALASKPGYHLVVVTSTVMPGTVGGPVRDVLERESGKRMGRDFGLCYGPEFIALGSVIRDFLHPDFVLIGESDARAGDLLEALYGRVCENSPTAARMNFVNAELAKLSVNTFVTTKIGFANMLARICERLPGSDVDVVTHALGLDSRIGGKYLKGAVSYGGPCFPRDNVALASFARGIGAPSNIAEATHQFNQVQIRLLAELVKKNTAEGGRAGILGLAYKPNTDVVEQSAGILLAQRLADDGVVVVAHDPAGNRNASKHLGKSVVIVDSPEECIEQADVVAVTTPWQMFREIPAEKWARRPSPRVVIDCWRSLHLLQNRAGVSYLALGTGDCQAESLQEAASQSVS